MGTSTLRNEGRGRVSGNPGTSPGARGGTRTATRGGDTAAEEADAATGPEPEGDSRPLGEDVTSADAVNPVRVGDIEGRGFAATPHSDSPARSPDSAPAPASGDENAAPPSSAACGEATGSDADAAPPLLDGTEGDVMIANIQSDVIKRLQRLHKGPQGWMTS